jgi:restriction system protein
MRKRRSLSEIRQQLEAERGDFGSEVYKRRLDEATVIARSRSRRVAAEVKTLERWLQSGLAADPTGGRGPRWFRRKPRALSELGAREQAHSRLSALPTVDGLPTDFTVNEDAPSHLLVVDYRLPSLDIVPHATSYKVDKTTADIIAVKRTTADRNAIYQSLVAQVTLRCLRAIFGDAGGSSGGDTTTTVVFNGFVESVDVASGHMTQACLISVRLTSEQFHALQLEQVDPVACLRALHAAVSPRPSELVAVQPIMRLDMTDSRFVAEDDVLSSLQTRPNLLDLTPSEFESLITNLFTCMGLETRLTQPSRDGGVDCVAFDLRPVLGGKVVIQAKRYANTVGVSAVRDLYGTVLNEGANKGVLVTTSGFGPAAFEFASGKPIELLSGANLLALLKEWAGIDARIVAPTADAEQNFIVSPSTTE